MKKVQWIILLGLVLAVSWGGKSSAQAKKNWHFLEPITSQVRRKFPNLNQAA